MSSVLIWTVYPDTKGLPLEEVAAIFGDADELITQPLETEVEREMKLDLAEVEISQQRDEKI
jgi:hypothetical protein